MSDSPGKYVCIHGHFYQPPRENPWLEVVEVQDSAAPFHDWNARVCAECYAPNAAARILGPGGVIADIVNNYRHISFNFGPTLLCWLEQEEPQVYEALLEADRDSLARLGWGNALAQVYNHVIMPLANRRDKLTQVRWGLADFQYRFGRRPQGMWLAETAVDNQTLECLAQEGILFTILAPHQAAQVLPPGGDSWREVGPQDLDTRRPYLVELPSGRELAVFFYHGGLSRDIAFHDLLADGAGLARRLVGAFDPQPGEAQLVSVATDGESYGHHHRFGEMALAFALRRLEQDPGVQLTNYAAFLARHPPRWRVRIRENSSWSCTHGVERWRADCGCALDPGRGWNQKWRAPLRRALDRLNRRLARLFQRQGGRLFKDPWAARDDYALLLPPRSREGWPDFLARHQLRPLDRDKRLQAALLLECQRFSQYMFTSCAWFFDDLAGLEAVQNLRYAARALQLAGELEPGDWEEDFLSDLEPARSNQAGEGGARDIWRRRVVPARTGPKRVVAHAAMAGVVGKRSLPRRLYCYRLEDEEYHQRHGLGLHLCWGKVTVSHQALERPHRLAFAAMHGGGHDFTALVCPARRAGDLAGLGRELESPLRLMERRTILDILARRLPGRRYHLGHLFVEERRRLACEMILQTTARHLETARALYQDSLETMRFLRRIEVPLPRVCAALAQAVMAEDLVRALEGEGEAPGLEQARELASQARELGLELPRATLARALETALVRRLQALAHNPRDPSPVGAALELLELARTLAVEPPLWQAQNIFHRLRERLSPGLAGVEELARELGFSAPDGEGE